MEHTFDPSGESSDAALAAIPAERLEAEICATAAHLAAGTCRFLLLVAEFDRREGYHAWECVSTAHWLNWKCGLGMHAAREQVRVARRLTDLPHVRAAFATGRLSFSKVRAISRVAHPAIEADLVSMGEHATAQQMEEACGALRRCRDLDEAEEDLVDRERRAAALAHLTTRREDDGGMAARLRLAPEDADIVRRALDVAVRRLDHGQPEDGPVVSLDQLRASALVELARTYLAGPEHDSDGPHPEIVVHVDLSVIEASRREDSPTAAGTFRQGDRPPSTPTESVPPTNRADPADRGRADADLLDPLESWRWPVVTTSGTHLSLATLARLASDAGIRWVADLPDGTQLDLGRHRRRPNRQMMRALRARDGHCRFPGCSSRHRLHAHHIIWWTHGGRTDMDNLILLCGKHHHAVHDRRWVCTGTAAEPRFARPDGEIVDRRGPALSGQFADLLTAHERSGLDVCVDAPGGRWCGERIEWDCFFAAFAVPEAAPSG